MEKFSEEVLIIKVGTSTLTQKHADGTEQLDVSSFERIASQLVELQGRGFGIILVSSAAITAGMAEAGLAARPPKDTRMPELQMLASIGWRHVLNAWSGALPGKQVGELLLTQHELGLASERDELLRVTHALLSHGHIAIANENDAIAHEEIAFGDNDSLAAIFAARIARSELFGGRVRLVVLSDVEGVYADKTDPSTLIKQIGKLDGYRHLAGGAGSQNGTGGMVTKFEAARIATGSGVTMWITNGRTENTVMRAISGEIGTEFTVNANEVV
jgi:glutamate 5-kinase